MSLKFKSIKLEDWRQYRSVEIDFHPSLTVITGPNGTGKSTILGFLGRHFGYERNLLSTPKKSKKTGILTFSTGIFRWLKSASKRSAPNDEDVVGMIWYDNDESCEIKIPRQNSIQYQANLYGQKTVAGLHIDSHRPPAIYKPVPNISTSPLNKSNIAGQIDNELRHFYTQGQGNKGTLFHIKSALISMSMFGYGNQTMEPDQELIDLFHGFEEKLSVVLPKSLGFEQLLIRVPEVILSTKSGEFVLDAASGGVLKLFEITWQIYFQAQKQEEFVVTMDEPENHLHPSMQRTILVNLKKAFPKVQFIVVTHSPFIVSSVKDSNV
ncbi:AAA family ATPase [Roseovarius indicus]|uniref:AAA family ATPase n=1 Tax=Roseovarius indicus TaxID=540747 RepID=UPI0032EAD5F3